MQAIHNRQPKDPKVCGLFQRAKIQDKCKQFTTVLNKCSSFWCCFKEQRYKINASNSQQESKKRIDKLGCFKEQRYKINASNSQLFKIKNNF